MPRGDKCADSTQCSLEYHRKCHDDMHAGLHPPSPNQTPLTCRPPRERAGYTLAGALPMWRLSLPFLLVAVTTVASYVAHNEIAQRNSLPSTNGSTSPSSAASPTGSADDAAPHAMHGVDTRDNTARNDSAVYDIEKRPTTLVQRHRHHTRAGNNDAHLQGRHAAS